MLEIKESNIPELFKITKIYDKSKLQFGRSKPIFIKFPLKLDGDIAKISAMLLDGTIDKNLKGGAFSQKKDKSKAYEFYHIIKNKFNYLCNLYKRDDETYFVNFNKTLANFLYFCLGINKCDEKTKIPEFIYISNKNIKIEYLRYAFAMEGSVTDPTTGNKEIKFHSCDLYHTQELKSFLKKYFNLNFKFERYYIKDYGWKYYLYINKSKEIKNFSKIGIALETHDKRIKEILKLIKPKAWEITLLLISKIKNDYFSFKDVWLLFPELKAYRSVNDRLKYLQKNDFVDYNRITKKYSLTEKGWKKSEKLSDINILKLRTNPIENETNILDYLTKFPNSWINNISRNLKINRSTVKDTLRRLEKANKIRLTKIDKFQRKFYKKL